LNQLSGQDAGFKRLAQAHRVGDQDSGTRLSQGLQGGIELIRHQVHGTTVAELDAGVIGHAAAALAFNGEERG
jgi:hypothetical protein